MKIFYKKGLYIINEVFCYFAVKRGPEDKRKKSSEFSDKVKITS